MSDNPTDRMQLRVLVFDDEPAVGRAVVRVAAIAGFDAVAVCQPEAFVQELLTTPPDVIVLDLQLGATDGVAQLEMLSRRGFTGSLVLISGFDEKILETAGEVATKLGLNIRGTLSKPLSLAGVEKILDHARLAAQPLTVQRLREAISNDELYLDFQPIVTRNPNSLRKLEVLVRWDHPVLGRLLPAAFLPIASENVGAMDELNEWVIGGAIEAYQVLDELGTNVAMSVNIPILCLHDRTLPDRLADRLRASNVPPHHLHFELSESAAVQNAARTLHVLTRLRLKGVELAISNFGGASASLKLLREMPVSEIKIDRSLTQDMAKSAVSQSILRAIIDLAADLKIRSVAEGVETAAAAQMLEQLGIGGMQGNYIASPMPIEAVSSWLAIWTHSALIKDSAESREDSVVLLHVPVEPADISASDAPTQSVQLPPRQLQVMRLLSGGCTVKEIARQLDLSPGTVKVHLSHAYSTLGARNRIEAIRRAGMLSTTPAA
jgi:EAL domain-containing protein (putative c-di-GMP-specific phosphodiesterase class I)/DNA-binding CsgD family transcriptional regulator